MEQLMDGKVVAEHIYARIRADFSEARQSGQLKRKPKLVVVMIGNNESSAIYVRMKMKACENLGFDFELDHHQEGEKYSTKDVIEIVRKHNTNQNVDGIIVQMPLPPQIEKSAVIKAIDPAKDVDGLNPFNYGETTLGMDFEYYAPPTGRGVITMLEYYNVPITGQRVVVIGSGIIAGKAIAIMLSNRKATVTICNSKTPDLAEISRQADILVVAVGSPRMITADMIKEGAVVVDVGISKDGLDKTSGDVDFEQVKDRARLISPVPGGVGKLTVACLMLNLLKAAINTRQI